MPPLENQNTNSQPPPQPIQQQYQPPPAPTVIYYPNEQNTRNGPKLYGAYLLWLPPIGLLGCHHLYMRRIGWFFLYFFTFGLCGVGWLFDLIRMPFLVRRLEDEEEKKRYHLDEAYALWFPLGFLGLHQIYLRRWGWAVLYFFTCGLFGLGWLIDLCFIPYLVNQKNKSIEPSLLPNNTLDGGPIPGTPGAVVHVHHHYVPQTGLPANYGTYQATTPHYPQQPAAVPPYQVPPPATAYQVPPPATAYQVPPPTPAEQTDAPPAYAEKN